MSNRSSDAFPVVDGYRIEAVLGRGSMATVYRATQLAMGRPVALKILKRDFSSKERVVGRLMREARIAARFNHRHIVRAHDAGVQGDLCFFVMELVEGVSVRDLIERKGPLAEAEAVRIGIQITEALIQLRRERVVHRDIKPANILIDQDGMALLADLGLAKLEFDASMTSKDHAVGTPAYMSPEQIQDPDHLDSRADIYSLGASLYAMLTGRSPHQGANVGETISKILYEEPAPLRTANPRVSAELETVIHRMLAKDRNERQGSPSLLLRDLLAVEAGRRPPSAAAAARRARAKVRTRMGGILLVLLTAGFAIWASRGDEEAEDAKAAPPSSTQPSQIPLDMRPTSDLIAAIEQGVAGEEDRATKLLEERVESVLVDQIEKAKRRVAAGDDAGARRLLEVDLAAAISRRLSVDFGALPEIARQRIEERRRRGLELILELTSQRRGAERAALRAALEAAAAEFEGEFASPEDLRELLTKTAEDKTRWELTPAERDLLVADVIRSCLRRWMDDIDRSLDHIRGLVRARRFLSARRSLDSLSAKRPERVDAQIAPRIEAMRDALRREESDVRRAAQLILSGIDVDPSRGRPELTRLDAKAVVADLNAFLAPLPEYDDELGDASSDVRLVRDMARAMTGVAHWRDSLGEALEALVNGIPMRVEIRGRKPVEGARLVDVEGDVLTFQVENSPKSIETPVWKMTAAWLLKIQPLEDVKARAIVFLLLEDELAAEQALASLADDDPFVRHLTPIVTRAFEARNHIRSPVEKEAFTLLTAALRARREGRIDDAARVLEQLMATSEYKRTAWFRENAAAIRRLRAEVRLQERAEELRGRFRGRVDLTSTTETQARFQLSYDFEDADQARDFLLPVGGWVGKGRLERKLPESGHRVRPDQVSPVVLESPIEPSQGVVRIDITLRTSAEVSELPRCFTISIGDEHIAFVGALRRMGTYRHLPLHGLEWAIPSRWEVHRVVYWKGALDGVVRALGDPASWPRMRFEAGRTYEISVVRDASARTLMLAVDGEVVLKRKGLNSPPTNGILRIHEPMPWAVENLRIAGFLTL